MYRMTFLLAVILLIFNSDSIAQRRFQPPDRPERTPKRLEQFRKMRLIEVLKLDEEQSVRFFAKQSVHEEKKQKLMATRNDLLDQVELILREERDVKELEKPVNQILEIDQQVFTERQRFQREIRELVTPVQFAKFIVFERNFGRQVRDAMRELHRERPESPGEE